MNDNAMLCLNVPAVKERMKKKRLSIKDLAFLTGRNEHTISRYFRQPDKINLQDITEMARVLGLSMPEYDSFVIIAFSMNDYIKLKEK